MSIAEELSDLAHTKGGETRFDLFAKLFKFIDKKQAFYPALQDLELLRWHEIEAEASAFHRMFNRSTSPFSIPDQIVRQVSSWEYVDPKDILASTWALLIGIDRSYGGISLLSSEIFSSSGEFLSRLRKNHRLNDATDGHVLPKGARFDSGDNPVLRNCSNLTYVPGFDPYPAIDYDCLPRYLFPPKSWEEPWKIGFICVASEADELMLKVHDSPERKSYFLRPTEKRRVALIARVIKAVKTLVEKQADIIILPELAIDPTILEAISSFLEKSKDHAPLVIAGTHSLSTDTDPGPNRAVAIAGHNDHRWLQDKLYGYKIPKNTADRWGINDTLGLKGTELAHEFMRPENHKIAIRDCSLGRLVILICQDFSVDASIRPILEYIGPTHIIVPVLDSPLTDFASSRTRWHNLAARHLGDRASASFVCNSRYISAWQAKKSGATVGKEPNPFALAYVPSHGRSFPNYPSVDFTGGAYPSDATTEDYFLWDELEARAKTLPESPGS